MDMPSSRIFRRNSDGTERRGTLDAAVQTESVRLLAEREEAAVAGGIGALAIVAIAAIFHPAGIWLAPLIALRIGSMILNHRSARRILARIEGNAPFDRDLSRLERSMLVAGASWGAMTWPIAGPNLEGIAAILILVTVLTAVGVLTVTSAVVPRAMKMLLAGYAPAVGMPLLIALPGIGPLHLLAAMAFVAGMAFYGGRIGRQTREGLAVRLENQMLAAELTDANNRLADALAEAERLSQEDSLTGLLNRRAFAGHAERLVNACHGRAVFLMLVDLDHFKAINDGFGHETGDSVLQAAADAIVEMCGARSVCARWGGEEFLVALSEPALAGARAIAERVRRTLSGLEHCSWPDGLTVSASIGVARWEAGEPLDRAIAAADAAMYRAKQAGRDRMCLASELDPPGG